MKHDPWSDTSYAMEIIFSLAILIVALLVGWFGVSIQVPVLVFGASIFIAVSLCWLVADIWRATRLRVLGWILPAPCPEVGVTFSWGRRVVSVCVYLVRINIVLTLYWKGRND